MLVALSLRSPGTPAPAPADAMRLVAGVGAEGDRHADALSPRQLLLASADTYRALALPPQALRENLLLDDDVAYLPSGTVLRIGEQAQVRLMFACEACGRLDLHGERLATRIGTRRGVLARVVRGGAIRPGDPVANLGQGYPAWPDDWRERVRQVLDAAPDGTVVGYAQLARLAGIQPTYCRAFPRLLRALGKHYANKAITANASTALIRWNGAGLFDSIGNTTRSIFHD